MSSCGQPPLYGYVDPNFPNPCGPNDAPIIIYGYTPSFALGVLGVVLFLISSGLHGWQLFKYRTWYFTPMLVGVVMEMIGYIFRIFSSRKDPYNVLYFVVQYFFIVVAPVFFSAGIYTILSILIPTLGRKYAPISNRWVLVIFITCDVVATGVQVAGAASIGKAESNREDPTTANNILLAGLVFQCFSFLLFIVLSSIFLWRAREVAKVHLERGSLLGWTSATVLVYLRTCFRLGETAEGVLGHLSTHEVFFGCLEFAPIAIAVFLFNIWHPGRCVPRATSQVSETVVEEVKA